MSMFGYQVLLGLGTLVAMAVATKITLRYAVRPDGRINQYGQAQVFHGTDAFGSPLPPPPPAAAVVVEEEKPLWVIWGQLFGVAELAVLLVVALLTGGFGMWGWIFGQGV